MSTTELEAKIRELRQLQALIEEAAQEAARLKEQLKASMGSAEELRAGEYKNMEDHQSRPAGRCGPEKGPHLMSL